MKKVVKSILSIMLVVSLMTACSSTSDDNMIGTKLFKECFIEMIDEIDKMDYDSCCTLLAEKGYDYSATAASDSDIGNIKIQDTENPGFGLAIYFYENNSYSDTIYLISYSDGDYEVSATDNCHLEKVTYNTHNSNATPANNQVSTVEELASFIFDEVPQLKLEYGNKTKENENIDVQIDVQTNPDNSFTITTNLPNNTQLMITLSGTDYTAQDKITVNNGKAISSTFSNGGMPLSGSYNLEVTMPLPTVQSDDVKDIIGINGEFLTGQYVVDSSIGNSKTIKASFDINI